MPLHAINNSYNVVMVVLNNEGQCENVYMTSGKMYFHKLIRINLYLINTTDDNLS